MASVDFEVVDNDSSKGTLPKPIFDKDTSVESLIKVAIASGTYKDPYAGITFKEFNPIILNKDGEVEFEANVIFPDWFDENCVKVVASRYLSNAAKQQETDLCQMIDRVSNTITNWGIKDGYFKTESEALEFNYKLKYYQIHQYFAFNSPVYFNIGLNVRQQGSACFINSIDDTMESIMDFAKTEALIFRQGSGSGANLSKIRSSVETVGGGTGFASGPCSFMKGHDTFASVIKSGGRLRRAAKFCRLDVDHPDIHKFIICKNKEEEKLRLIKNAGIQPDPGYEISDEVSLQNTNISVGIPDEFMNAVINDEDWSTKEVKTGKIHETMKARSLLMEIAQQSWDVADPGVQFDTTINNFNTTPAQGRINSSNPCVVGDTLLRSPEGDFKIRDLVESGRTEIPVYCCDPTTGEVHIRMGRNPRKTGEKKPVYKVTFSKGRGGIHSITTTANHKFIDSNGNTVLCKDLIFDTDKNTKLISFVSPCEAGFCTVIGVEYAGEEDVYNITVDEFHTVAWGEVITHNCGEFLAPDNSSCNLASLNLVKFFDFFKTSVEFNNDVYKDVIDTVITAQDILVDNAEYPTEKIREMTTTLRSLGLGYTGLGSLCMRLGFPYDSDDARIVASLLTSLMSRYASETSANIADIVGPGRWFSFDENREAFRSVLKYQFDQSLKATTVIHSDKLIIKDIRSIVYDTWKNAEYDLMSRSFRNSQLSLIAPTGTISFIMMSNSFGCEPHFALITYKRLSGSNGAILKTVVDDVSISLSNLGYDDSEKEEIIDKLVNHDIPIEQIDIVKKEHIDIFTTAVPPTNGKNFISHMGHIRMMAAIQPFINGAISKTCNLPKETTPNDIYNLYIACWELGLKSLTVYRDGSKENQVLSTTDKETKSSDNQAPEHLSKLTRKKLPTERNAKINKFTINGTSGKIDGYLIRGLYDNGELGEVFIEFAKDGTVVKGLVGAIVTLTSIAIQYGVPLEELVEKMIFRKFDPSGWVQGDPNIKVCNSIVDYIFQHLAYQHLDDDQLMKLGLKRISGDSDPNVKAELVEDISNTQVCPKCNGIMRFLGRCMTCLTCAYSDGGSCS